MISGYALGLFFIFLVAIIWSAASVLVQYIYKEHDSFHSAFMLTYIGVSLFSLWLPFRCVVKFFNGILSPRRTEVPVSEYRSVSFDEASPLAEEDGQEDHFVEYGEQSIARGIPWTDEDHLRVAIQISPVWFLANWTYNGSLAFTSITSSTVLASMGSLFTFMFAVFSGDETFGYYKLAGVFMGVLGSILTALHDGASSDDESSARPLLGDILGLLSAVGYGAYAVQTRVLCPHDESLYSMQILLGYIGLINMLVLSPIAIYQVLHTVELPMEVLGLLVVKGLFDNVLSDYLWLRAVMLTSATVATVGLGLTIPLAFIGDIAMGHSGVFSAGAIFGAVAVLAGFVLVNTGHRESCDGKSAEDEVDSDDSIQLPQLESP